MQLVYFLPALLARKRHRQTPLVKCNKIGLVVPWSYANFAEQLAPSQNRSNLPFNGPIFAFSGGDPRQDKAGEYAPCATGHPERVESTYDRSVSGKELSCTLDPGGLCIPGKAYAMPQGTGVCHAVGRRSERTYPSGVEVVRCFLYYAATFHWPNVS